MSGDGILLSLGCFGGLGLIFFGTAVILPLQGFGNSPKIYTVFFGLMTVICALILVWTVPLILKLK